jgi:hypothetical protein
VGNERRKEEGGDDRPALIGKRSAKREQEPETRQEHA